MAVEVVVTLVAATEMVMAAMMVVMDTAGAEIQHRPLPVGRDPPVGMEAMMAAAATAAERAPTVRTPGNAVEEADAIKSLMK